MAKRTMPTRTLSEIDMDTPRNYRSVGIGAVQYYVYRCLIGQETRDVLAVDADHARVQTGAHAASELCPWPIPMLDDMRSQWEELKRTDYGIRKMQRWMCAAVRMEIIDAEQFDKMALAVEQAKEVLR